MSESFRIPPGVPLSGLRCRPESKHSGLLSSEQVPASALLPLETPASSLALHARSLDSTALSRFADALPPEGSPDWSKPDGLGLWEDEYLRASGVPASASTTSVPRLPGSSLIDHKSPVLEVDDKLALVPHRPVARLAGEDLQCSPEELRWAANRRGALGRELDSFRALELHADIYEAGQRAGAWHGSSPDNIRQTIGQVAEQSSWSLRELADRADACLGKEMASFDRSVDEAHGHLAESFQSRADDASQALDAEDTKDPRHGAPGRPALPLREDQVPLLQAMGLRAEIARALLKPAVGMKQRPDLCTVQRLARTCEARGIRSAEAFQALLMQDGVPALSSRTPAAVKRDVVRVLDDVVPAEYEARLEARVRELAHAGETDASDALCVELRKRIELMQSRDWDDTGPGDMAEAITRRRAYEDMKPMERGLLARQMENAGPAFSDQKSRGGVAERERWVREPLQQALDLRQRIAAQVDASGCDGRLTTAWVQQLAVLHEKGEVFSPGDVGTRDLGAQASAARQLVGDDVWAMGRICKDLLQETVKLRQNRGEPGGRAAVERHPVYAIASLYAAVVNWTRPLLEQIKDPDDRLMAVEAMVRKCLARPQDEPPGYGIGSGGELDRLCIRNAQRSLVNTAQIRAICAAAPQTFLMLQALEPPSDDFEARTVATMIPLFCMGVHLFRLAADVPAQMRPGTADRERGQLEMLLHMATMFMSPLNAGLSRLVGHAVLVPAHDQAITRMSPESIRTRVGTPLWLDAGPLTQNQNNAMNSLRDETGDTPWPSAFTTRRQSPCTIVTTALATAASSLGVTLAHAGRLGISLADSGIGYLRQGLGLVSYLPVQLMPASQTQPPLTGPSGGHWARPLD